jgi:thiamine-phosphate pyrophosphorylase
MSESYVGTLHVITDETLQERFRHDELAAAAVDGGADVVQYRDKRSLPPDTRLAMARRVVAACGQARCVVNDHVAIARRAGAWGVHLGPEDTTVRKARTDWPRAGCVGVTANDLARALRVAAEPVDYIGVGPVFRTTSKSRSAPVLGLSGLRRIVAAVDRPVIAIGGIDVDNVAAVLAAGAAGVAVLSSVVAQRDPRAATARFRAILDSEIARGVAV